MSNFLDFNLQTLVIIIAALAYAIPMWRNSKFKGNKDLLDTLAAQLTLQENLIKTLQDNHQKNVQEIGRLSGIIEQLEKTIKLQSDIIENRNPDLEKSLSLLVDTMNKLSSFPDEVRKHWTEEQNFMVQKV